MESLEGENQRLRSDNKRLQQELDRVEYKYQKLKSEYIGLMKRSVQFEMELQKHQRLLASRNLQLQPSEEESDQEIIELHPQQSFTLKDGQVLSNGGAPLPVVHHSKQSEPRQLRKSQAIEGERLFEAFFILEPFGDLHYQTKYCFPEKPQLPNFEPLRNRLDKFVFPGGVSLELLEDDEEGSRRNEVLFGSLGYDLLFILENDRPYVPVAALRSLNPSGRFFCYVFLKPSIMNTDTKSLLEGEICFCFITRCPFREFFCDLNRSMQQTIKLRYINREPDKPPGFEYSHFSSLLENIYSARVDTFPLNRTWRTEGSELKLTIQSETVLKQQDRDLALAHSKRLSPLVLSQLLHYVLVEAHLLFFTPDRKLLNDMFQFLRVLIRPLVWPFPIIYTLGEELLLMLQSPVPVLLGASKSREQVESSGWDLSEVTVLDLAAMKFILVQEPLLALEPSILQLAKHFQIEQNRLGAAEWFVSSKLNFISTGITPAELSAFDLQFMETQMVEQHRLLTPR